MQEITSRSNQHIKVIRGIRTGRSKSEILIEGARLVTETLRSDVNILKSFFSKDFVDREENKQIISILEDKSDTYVVNNKIFDSLSDTRTSQGIILIGQRPEMAKELIERALKTKSEKPAIVIALQKISNPSNLGAIFRVAEASDVSGFIISEESADPYSAKANRAALGSNFRIPVWAGENLETVIEWARTVNLATTCADINSDDTYTKCDWNKKRLVVFGSEAHGLSPDERKLIDEGFRIPMSNGVESLNIAVSCGIILFSAREFTREV